MNAFLRMLSRRGARAQPSEIGTTHTGDFALSPPAAHARALGLPAGTDWAWRPDTWAQAIVLPEPAPKTPLAPGVTLFHDGRRAALTLRQEARAASTTASFGLELEVAAFDGSFMSLSLDLPAGAAEGLRRRHLIRLDTWIECDRPLGVFVRLNLKCGREVVQLLQSFRADGSAAVIEFDLAPLHIDERQIERLWIDLILEQPAMNRILLHEMIASRLPRAEL